VCHFYGLLLHRRQEQLRRNRFAPLKSPQPTASARQRLLQTALSKLPRAESHTHILESAGQGSPDRSPRIRMIMQNPDRVGLRAKPSLSSSYIRQNGCRRPHPRQIDRNNCETHSATTDSFVHLEARILADNLRAGKSGVRENGSPIACRVHPLCRRTPRTNVRYPR